MELSVEEMYDELCGEIDSLNKSILAAWDFLDMNVIGTRGDFLHDNIKGGLYIYKNVKSPTNFFCTLDTYIKDRGLYHFFPFDGIKRGRVVPCMVKFSSLPDTYQDIITAIAKEFTPDAKANYTRQKIRDLIRDIAQTNPTAQFELLNGYTGEIICTL